jgi:hypothetical protein
MKRKKSLRDEMFKQYKAPRCAVGLPRDYWHVAGADLDADCSSDLQFHLGPRKLVEEASYGCRYFLSSTETKVIARS